MVTLLLFLHRLQHLSQYTLPSEVDNYKLIKAASDRKVGVVSQVIVAASAGVGRRNQAKQRGRPQYIANVSLKINQKLGGKNVACATPLPKIGGKKFMLLGACCCFVTVGVCTLVVRG